EQYERCKQILTEHKSQLELIAKTLLVEETLVAEQIHSLFNEGKLPEVKYDDSHLEEDNEPDEDKYEGDLTQQEGTLDVEDDKLVNLTKRLKKKNLIIRKMNKNLMKKNLMMSQHIKKNQISMI